MLLGLGMEHTPRLFINDSCTELSIFFDFCFKELKVVTDDVRVAYSVAYLHESKSLNRLIEVAG